MLATVMILPASAAEFSVADILGKPHDCIIQPFIATELGSPATGILEELLVDRGDRVTKGMVVARLRSDLEQASLDLATARAESTVIIELGRERVSLLKKEVARVSELHVKQISSTVQYDKSLSELQQAVLQLRQAETEQQPDAWVHNSTEQEIDFADTRVLVREVINSLPPPQQQAIELAFFRGMSQREIAANTNTPLGTVKTRLELGLKKIYDGLKELRDEL